MAMRNVATWLGTTPFDERFLEVWDDIEGRFLLIEAHAKGWEDSELAQVLRATIWQVKVMDELATAFFAAVFKKRFPRGESVGSRHNPFKRKAEEDAPVRTALQQAMREKEQQDIAALWFGDQGANMMRMAQELEASGKA